MFCFVFKILSIVDRAHSIKNFSDRNPLSRSVLREASRANAGYYWRKVQPVLYNMYIDILYMDISYNIVTAVSMH